MQFWRIEKKACVLTLHLWSAKFQSVNQSISQSTNQWMTQSGCRDLSKNKLVRLSGLAFQGLGSLLKLKLQRNELSLLEDGVFYGLNKLQYL